MNGMTIFYISISILLIALSLGLGLGLGLGLKNDDKSDDDKSDNETKDRLNVVYINLDKRVDRNEQILGEIKEFSSNYNRLSATYNEKGYLGCAMSHIRCLEYAIKNNLEHYLVLEDDFTFVRNKNEVYDEINNFIDNEKDWDVLLLSCNKEKRENHSDIVDKVKNSQTTSGFLVNKYYYQKLLNNFRTAYKQLEKTDNQNRFSIDMYWKLLQETDNWFVLKKVAGIQRESYRDIEKKTVNYGV